MVTQEELEKMSPQEIAELQKQNCIFCKIIGGEIPSQKIFEDDLVASILDINPATKGHTLIFPKEHYPILPLVPPPTFKKLFVDAKLIATNLKKATLSSNVSLFIANGALAGQQSPHFLFHLLPNYSFDLKPNPSILKQHNELADPLKNNLNIMMKNHAKREGGQLSQVSSTSSAQQRPPTQEEIDKLVAQKQEQIAKIIEENSDVRELIKSDPQQFIETVQQNDQLSQLFQGVNIQELSNNLKLLDQKKESSQLQQPSTSTPIQHEAQQVSPPPKAEVFLGQDPYAQKERVFAYFEEKPKAKELLMNDPDMFLQLLENRDDVKPIFQQVDIKKLSQKLNEAQGGDTHD